MFALLLMPVYIAFHVHILIWLFKWISACVNRPVGKGFKIGFSIVYGFLSLTFLIGFLLPHGAAERFLKGVGNYALGITIYLAFAMLVANIAFAIYRSVRKKNILKAQGLSVKDKEAKKKVVVPGNRKLFILGGSVVILFVAVMSIWGSINAKIVRTTTYDITINKAAEVEDMKILLVSDLHLGYNIGIDQMQQMADAINAQDADIVVIAGDIFDNEYDALEDPDALIEIFKSIKSKHGMYAVYGNHDIAEKILAGFTFGSSSDVKEADVRMDEFLEKAGIINLRDEGVMIDGVYFYGRPDYARLGRGITVRKTVQEIMAEAPAGVPVITIDHQPKELHEKAAAGIDVDLGGHTHDGQFFPLNISSRIIWENSAGCIHIDEKMHSIVTSGVGLFGPNMRVGTIAEVVAIQVHFAG